MGSRVFMEGLPQHPVACEHHNSKLLEGKQGSLCLHSLARHREPILSLQVCVPACPLVRGWSPELRPVCVFRVQGQDCRRSWGWTVRGGACTWSFRVWNYLPPPLPQFPLGAERAAADSQAQGRESPQGEIPAPGHLCPWSPSACMWQAKCGCRGRPRPSGLLGSLGMRADSRTRRGWALALHPWV